MLEIIQNAGLCDANVVVSCFAAVSVVDVAVVVLYVVAVVVDGSDDVVENIGVDVIF